MSCTHGFEQVGNGRAQLRHTQSNHRFTIPQLTSPTPATMPTTVYGAGALGRITDGYFAASGFKTLALMDAASS